jgi:hypothetical protein
VQLRPILFGILGLGQVHRRVGSLNIVAQSSTDGGRPTKGNELLKTSSVFTTWSTCDGTAEGLRQVVAVRF